MINLLQAYRGVLTNENLLVAGAYDESAFSSELLALLLEKGYAIQSDESLTSVPLQDEPVVENETNSTILVQKAMQSKPKRKTRD